MDEQDYPEVPSAFPAWLIAEDPLLENAAHNAAYECFRRRRKVHATRVGDLIPSITPAALLQLVALVVALVLVTISLMYLGFFGLPLYAVALVVYFRMRQRARIIDQRMPRWLSTVFSINGYREQHAIELWMTGLKGSEIAEAIYIEQRERTWWIAPGSALLCLGFLTIGILKDVPFLNVGSLLFVAAWLYLAFEIIQSGVVAGMHATGSWAVIPRVGSWGADAPLTESIGEGLIKGAFFLGWFLFGMLILWVMTIFVFGITILLQSLFMEPINSVLVGFSILFVVIGYLLRRARDPWYDYVMSKTRMAISDADSSFEEFMVRVAMKDRNVNAWEEQRSEPTLQQILGDIGPSEARWKPIYTEEEEKDGTRWQ